MGFIDNLFSSSNKNTQTQTQNGYSNTQMPDAIVNEANANLGEGNYQIANWNPTMQQTPYGFTPLQVNAMNDAATFQQTAGANNPMSQQAANFTTQAGNWQPQQVQGQGYTAQNVDPSMMGGYEAAQMQGPANVSAQMAGAGQAGSVNATATLLGNAQGYKGLTGQASQINRGDIQDVNGPDTGAQLQSFMGNFNPAYQSDVINASLTDLDRARQMTQMGNAAQAAQAGAFGSTRQGVMDAETNDDFARQAASMSANLRNQGFQTGLSALQNQQGLQQQAALANQGVSANVAGQNAGFGQQMGLQNLANQQGAEQYGAQMANTFAQTNAGAQNQVSLANAAAANQAAAMNAQLQTQANLANQNASLQASLANQGMQYNTGAFNAGARNTAGQFNAGQTFQGALANQQAGNTAAQYNSGQNFQGQLANQAAGQAQAGMQLGAGNQFMNIGQGNFNQQQGAYNTQIGAGNQQQQYGQNVQDVNYANAQAANNAGMTRVGMASQLLQNTPVYGQTSNYGATSTGTGTQTNSPSLMSDFGQVAGIASGMKFSDMRLKENIVPVGNSSSNPAAKFGSAANLGAHTRDPLKAVRRMRPVHYNWKGAPAAPKQLGLLAQNVEQAAPEAVATHPSGYKMISHPAMLGLLTGAIGQLADKVDSIHAPRKRKLAGVAPPVAPAFA